MSKWILLIVLAALALGSAFYLTRSDAVKDFETLENGGEQPAIQVEKDTPAANLRGLGPNPNSTNNRGTGGPDRTQRSSLGPQITAATAGGEFHVLLIDPRSRNPLEGMHVYLLDREKLGPDDWRNAGSNLRDLRRLIKENGVETLSDKEGGAYFERVLDGAVWAEGSGWQGFYDWIGPPESPLALHLTPHSELEVIVLDEEDNIVRGAPLAILSQKPDQWVALLKRSTLGTGLAQFPGVSNFANRASKEVPLAVGFHFPHSPRVWQVIDPEWLPEDPIELRIPPSAPLTIRVLDGDGEPLEGTFTAELGMANEEEGKRVTAILSRRGNGGEVTFPFVGANTPVRLQLGGHKELKNLIVDVRGPSQGEKGAVREVSWYEKRLRVSGTVRGPGGPLANRRMQASWGDGRERRSLPVSTDAQGQFTVPMSVSIGGYLHLRALPQGKMGPSDGSVALPKPLPNGDWDAGVIELKGEALFAEGRVVDLSGVTIQGAQVRLEAWRSGRAASSAGKAGSKSGGGKSGEGKSDETKESEPKQTGKEEGHWGQVGRLFGVTDEQGRFKIYGRSFSKTMRLTASHREHLTQSIEDVQSGMPPWYFNLERGIQPGRVQPSSSEER
ncbi:MAG: hypothetical protein P1V35_05120 [Planctomycetota bacterium]|nr:hypothetical protein [Planctomycetota bacterium]